VEGDLQRAVGRNIRAYREAEGVSQEAFADVLEVHRTYMGGIERGERNLTLRSLERLAEGLRLDPLVLLREAPAKDDDQVQTATTSIICVLQRSVADEPASFAGGDILDA
jgi:transcriptional regulator with XRE-family HTH domain